MQQLSQVRSALTVEKSYRTVEYWRIPRAQMKTSCALNQIRHEPLVRRPGGMHVVPSRWWVMGRCGSELVELVDDHSVWGYAKGRPVWGYSLGGLNVHGRLSVVA